MQSAVNMVNATAIVVCVNVLIRGEVPMAKEQRVVEVIVVREIGDRVVILRNSGRMLHREALKNNVHESVRGNLKL
tara:strand:+ start:63 stop:290 length:228 start_codon:yes stop_codon:yes gene_type:complete